MSSPNSETLLDEYVREEDATELSWRMPFDNFQDFNDSWSLRTDVRLGGGHETPRSPPAAFSAVAPSQF